MRVHQTQEPNMPNVRLRYQTIEIDDLDIHLRTLRDKQQFADPFGEAESLGISSAQWSLFGVVWESSEILAQEMAHFPILGKRILEVGCGIGLSSLLLNARHADITATDIHPEAKAFLARNVQLNHGDPIPFLRTGWEDECTGLSTFDLIIGADLLYEQPHIQQLSAFIDQHANPCCEVILVDPGRRHRSAFSKQMVARGYLHTQQPSDYCDQITRPFNGTVLRYIRQPVDPATSAAT